MQIADVSQLEHRQSHPILERQQKIGESKSAGDRAESAEDRAAFARDVEKFAAGELLAQAKLFYAGDPSIGGDYSEQNVSARIAEFALGGAGESESMLKSGKNALFDSASAAQKIWGGNLPEIAGNSLTEAIKAIDMRLRTLGFPILSVTA